MAASQLNFLELACRLAGASIICVGHCCRCENTTSKRPPGESSLHSPPLLKFRGQADGSIEDVY